KFASPPGRTGQQKIGNVYARNQQYESDSSEQHQQDRLYIAQHFLPQWNQARADALVIAWKRRGRVARDLAHIGTCLLHGHPALQSADAVNSQASSALAQQRIVPLPNRHVDLRYFNASQEKIEIRGDYPHHGVTLSIQS